MLVKICGITRVADAMAAVAEGAGAIGFIMWPGSPRYLPPAQAREIVESLPPHILKVGVFVNQAAPDVNGAAELAGLTHVQLHGDESHKYAALMCRRVIKAVTAGSAATTDSWPAASWPAETIWLVDAHDPVRRGGTGQTADWRAAAALARQHTVWLAGGLTPANVAEAVAQVAPAGIDVSSGVEQQPGIKDHEKLKALFAALGAIMTKER